MIDVSNRIFKVVSKDGDKLLPCESFYKWLRPEIDWTIIQNDTVWDDMEKQIHPNFTSGNYFTGNEKGFVINKEMPKRYDIVWSDILPATISTSFCRPQVKQAIEEAKLTGIIFYPIWIKTYRPEDKPDYWMMSGTEIFDFRKYTVNPETKIGEKYIYKKELKNHLYDMSKPPALNENFFIPYLVSEKAKQVLEPFNFGLKGKKFEEVKFQ
jgi:hypothetical protein